MYTRLLIAVASLMLVLAAPVQAGDQQDKMKSCNAEASQKQLKGDDRKAFMKTCLSAKHDAAPPVSQQEKMKSCNTEAGSKGLKGDERKKFMSQCLSNKPAG